MVSNFEFLKNKDKKLFNIIDDAEKLYRDGYFEQTIAQTRKFAEIVCKNTLGVRRTTEETFDDMLATLKDILNVSDIDKEFIDDMYFLKKQGNLAVHDSAAEQTGSVALECLKRAFEVSINYSIKNGWANKKILNSNYSIDLLMTGKIEKLGEKYQKVKDELLKEGVFELADLAISPEEKVRRVDFKKKKVSYTKSLEDKKQKTAPSKKTTKKQIKKEKKQEKEENINSIEIMKYSITYGILFVLMIAIMLFILPL